MPIQLAIIGLGQIGASVGLSLAAYPDLVLRTGYDRDTSTLQFCIETNAIDVKAIDLTTAVQNADIVLLSLPIDQIQGAFTLIAGNLKNDALVLDTGPVKEAAAKWAVNGLPGGHTHIGLIPVINPVYLHEPDSGVSAAHADLFAGGMLAIVAQPATSSAAIKKTADLTRLLGAKPIFIPPHKMDRIMAATELMPLILAASLLNATVNQPEWREARSIAGRAYEQVTNPIEQLADADAISSAALLNQDNVLRIIDGTLAALQAIRKDIEESDFDALVDRFERAQKGRKNWWQHRQSGN
jgi:prephenate dehydrogenase